MRLHGMNDHNDKNDIYADQKKLYADKSREKFNEIKMLMQEVPLNCKETENGLLLFQNFQYNSTPFKDVKNEANSLQ